jgi:integrase
MKGHIRRRGERSWELKFDLGLDEKTGRRVSQFHSFRGTKREAQAKLAELIASVAKGSYVSRSNLTVGEHVTSRIAQWEALQKISPKTAERYNELLRNQIIPHIGQVPLQKLKPADIETWHATLKTSGRRIGQGGGLATLTIRHAHRLLSKALKEGMRHDLIVRNVAASEQPPKVERKEVVALDRDQVKLLVGRLRGHAMYPIVIVALFTGVRRGELLALKWHRVDLDSKKITVCEAVEETRRGIRFKTPKTDSGTRDVSLPEIVVETLREHRKQQLELRMRLGIGKLAGTPSRPSPSTSMGTYSTSATTRAARPSMRRWRPCLRCDGWQSGGKTTFCSLVQPAISTG